VTEKDAVIVFEYKGWKRAPWIFDVRSMYDVFLPEMLWKCPQWPWVVGTMGLLGETNDEVALIKLEHLLEEVKDLFQSGRFPISCFVAPNDFDNQKEFLTAISMFQKWEGMIGSVIAY
jgi:hypothetical protein